MVGELSFKIALSKNRRMLLIAAITRYSLVKGERIVRFVPTGHLREEFYKDSGLFMGNPGRPHSYNEPMWDSTTRIINERCSSH